MIEWLLASHLRIIKNNKEPKSEPCGTPIKTGKGTDKRSSTITDCDLSVFGIQPYQILKSNMNICLFVGGKVSNDILSNIENI